MLPDSLEFDLFVRFLLLLALAEKFQLLLFRIVLLLLLALLLLVPLQFLPLFAELVPECFVYLVGLILVFGIACLLVLYHRLYSNINLELKSEVI